METENTIMNATEESIENGILTEGFDKSKLVKGSLIVLGVSAVVTGIVMIVKNREKIKNHFTKRKIKDLEEKGYLVMNDYSNEFNEEVEVNPEKE